jgi:toxin ParE1/3/4
MTWRLTANAENDLRQIHIDGLERFGAPQAERFLIRMLDAFSEVAFVPLACRQRHDLKQPLRVKQVLPYLIFYEITDSDILIVRILHGHSDWQNEL